MIRYKFSRETDREFALTLKKRVNAYFKEQQKPLTADNEMTVKVAIGFSAYLLLYAIIIGSGISNIPALFGLWFLMGFAKAFIGTSVMHDAMHGAFSRNKRVNLWMQLSAIMVGVDPKIWSIQHNVLHHTYTNIEHNDEDIESRYIFRMTPHQPRRWFHAYQHIYAIVFYSIFTLIWITVKDLIKLIMYRKKKLVKKGLPFYQLLFMVLFRKALYLAVFLVTPLLVLEVPAGMVVMMFITMHLVAGVMLSIIFQSAHVMPSSSFKAPEGEKIDENWQVHQLLTTTNFDMKNRWLTWYIGGLNYQVEHHLFPNICHVHYPKIAKIVQQTTAEFNVPYYAQKNIFLAIFNHFNMLRLLGRNDAVPVANHTNIHFSKRYANSLE